MLTAFILVGGKSTRMGADKAFVTLNGRTLLDYSLDLARSVTETVRIVGLRSRFPADLDTVEDIYPDRGPLGGIHAALTATTTDLNLVFAVDMPFVTAEFLRYLVTEASRTTALVTVPRTSPQRELPPQSALEPGSHSFALRSEFQPLCAIYRRSFRSLAEAALGAGHNKIDRLFAPEHTRIIDTAELARLSFSTSMFDNLNTREELDRAAQQR